MLLSINQDSLDKIPVWWSHYLLAMLLYHHRHINNVSQSVLRWFDYKSEVLLTRIHHLLYTLKYFPLDKSLMGHSILRHLVCRQIPHRYFPK